MNIIRHQSSACDDKSVNDVAIDDVDIDDSDNADVDLEMHKSHCL